jgi:hypothetical protein
MKRIIITRFLLCIGTLIGFLSCSESFDETVTDPDSCNLKLEVEMNHNQGDLTRSVITSSRFPSEAQLGIYVKYAQNKYLANNLVANRSDGSWELETPVKLDSYTEKDSLTIYAYYPYSSSTKRVLPDSITIDIRPVGTMGQPDYLYGSSHGINRTNSTAKIKFNHALSLIGLNITNPNADKITITNVRVENDSLFEIIDADPTYRYLWDGSYLSTIGTMNLESGVISRKKESNAVINLSDSTEIQPGNSAIINVLVMPTHSDYQSELVRVDPITDIATVVHTYRGGIIFTVTTDVGESKLRIDEPSWRQGCIYTYRIVLDTIPSFSVPQ